MKKNLNRHNGSHGTTKVIFRQFREPFEVLALFPEVPADVNGGLCSSYMHIGQHGGADYHLCIHKTKPATPAEYAPLLKELKALGYCLIVAKHATQRDHNNRRNQAGTF